MSTPLIEMDNIEKHFGPVIALGGVSFNVMEGECHCLLGDNGAGKSTFIKTMSGVHKPTKGVMRVSGQDVAFKHANKVTMDEMSSMGINLREPKQAVGTLSGGERQTVAIARAVHFGAKVLILDEPTSALGVRQTSNVLATIDRVRKSGIGVIFITHNVRHAMAVGDRFTVLNRGQTHGTAKRGEIKPEELQDMMAGGQELAQLEGSLGGTV